MRIAIDVNCLSDSRRTGIGRYTENMLDALFPIAPDDQFILHAALPIDTAIKRKWSQYPHITYREGRFPSRYLWQQFIQGLRVAFDRADLYVAVDGLLPLFCPVPAVAVVHDILWRHYPETVGPFIYNTYRLRLRRSVKRARACIAVSHATRADLLHYSGIPGEKVHVVHQGVDAAFHAVERAFPDFLPPQITPARGYLLFVGNLKPHKNLRGLLEAFAILRRKREADGGICPHLVLAGTGGAREKAVLDQEIARLGLAEVIHLAGYVTDATLKALYAGALAFVFPSFIEGFGLPLLEAQAAGTPVLAAGCYSLPEVGGAAALYFDPHDHQAMADQMEKLVRDPQLRDNLSRLGRQNAEPFTWAKTAAGLRRVMQAAVTRPNPSNR